MDKSFRSDEDEVCTHEGCGQLYLDMEAHLREHRDSHVDLETSRCCSGCNYHTTMSFDDQTRCECGQVSGIE